MCWRRLLTSSEPGSKERVGEPKPTSLLLHLFIKARSLLDGDVHNQGRSSLSVPVSQTHPGVSSPDLPGVSQPNQIDI